MNVGIWVEIQLQLRSRDAVNVGPSDGDHVHVEGLFERFGADRGAEEEFPRRAPTPFFLRKSVMNACVALVEESFTPDGHGHCNSMRHTGGDNKQVVEKTVTRDRDNLSDRLLGQTQMAKIGGAGVACCGREGAGVIPRGAIGTNCGPAPRREPWSFPPRDSKFRIGCGGLCGPDPLEEEVDPWLREVFLAELDCSSATVTYSQSSPFRTHLMHGVDSYDRRYKFSWVVGRESSTFSSSSLPDIALLNCPEALILLLRVRPRVEIKSIKQSTYGRVATLNTVHQPGDAGGNRDRMRWKNIEGLWT
ncbi:hypothetical protein B0H14DRAFT_2639371 [Mycena olivaceomarginata]|nr:hypothetical protein B0H14DRAFT_2639371 [Mycena olivaceomarginata]